MKKIGLVLALALSVCLLAGCNTDSKGKPLESMPTTEELREFSEAHTKEEMDNRTKEVKDLMDSKTYEEICKAIDKSLQDWAGSQALLKLDRAEIEFSKDDLLMNEQANEKIYSNYSATVNLYFPPELATEYNIALYDKAFEEVKTALQATPYGAYKIGNITLFCFSTDNVERYMNTIGTAVISKILIPTLTEEELNIQTIAYDFAKSFNDEDFGTDSFNRHGEVSLRRFGIKPETNELYIEIPIYAIPKNSIDNPDPFKASLEGRSQELHDLIVADDKAVAYLKDKGATSITVAFSTVWEKQGEYFYTYKYELAK